MLADYLFEKDGVRVIQVEGGFLAWKVIGHQFYIADFFIASSHRQSSKNFIKLMRLAYDEAVKNSCDSFSCHVPLKLNDFSNAILIRLKFGFKIVTASAEELGMVLPLVECARWVRQ